jgi:lysophospholipase L1-like esterase
MVKIYFLITLFMFNLLNNTVDPETQLHGPDFSNFIKIACIGDSITYGAYLIDRPVQSYPMVLSNLLGNAFEVKNFGLSRSAISSSADYPYIKFKPYTESFNYNPDIIIIMLGTNDIKDNNWQSKETFINDYLKLIHMYKNLSSKPIIYIMTPPKGFKLNSAGTPPQNRFVNDERLKEVIDCINIIADIENVRVIDIYSATQAHPEYFLADGIHPDESGASSIAETVFESLRDINHPSQVFSNPQE